MALTIAESYIESDVTRHTAMQGPRGWSVSWLHDGLDKNAAITAMTLTEVVAQYEHTTPDGHILARSPGDRTGNPPRGGRCATYRKRPGPPVRPSRRRHGA